MTLPGHVLPTPGCESRDGGDGTFRLWCVSRVCGVGQRLGIIRLRRLSVLLAISKAQSLFSETRRTIYGDDEYDFLSDFAFTEKCSGYCGLMSFAWSSKWRSASGVKDVEARMFAGSVEHDGTET
jgi:hypothetical protein